MNWRELLGRKVTVRYRLHGDPDHPFSEVVGVVQSADEAAIVILTRRGDEVTVAPDDVLNAKVLPQA